MIDQVSMLGISRASMLLNGLLKLKTQAPDIRGIQLIKHVESAPLALLLLCKVAKSIRYWPNILAQRL